MIETQAGRQRFTRRAALKVSDYASYYHNKLISRRTRRVLLSLLVAVESEESKSNG